MSQEKVLWTNDLYKSIGSNTILNHINFNLRSGEIHGIYGENSTGKSTFINILSGIMPFDSGELFVFGNSVSFKNQNESQKLKIQTMFQHQNLFPNLTVKENLLLFQNNALRRKSFWYRSKQLDKEFFQLLEKHNLNLNLNAKVSTLSTGHKQLVEFLKLCMCNPKILLLDEPCKFLDQPEVHFLEEMILGLKKNGVAVVIVSHQANDLIHLCDRISVFRNNTIIATVETSHTNISDLIELAEGKGITRRYPKLPVEKGKVCFRAHNICTRRGLKNVSFSIREAEILGIAGYSGSGRTSLAHTILGLDKPLSGRLYLNSEPVEIKDPESAVKHGICYIPEDTLAEGLLKIFSVSKNISLPNMKQVTNYGILNRSQENDYAIKYIKRLDIKSASPNDNVRILSGGNQQKVMLSKWFLSDAHLFLFDEPTNNLDVASKMEIYNLFNEIVRNNKSVLLISSDFSELMGMCDRILVLNNGVITKELRKNEFSLNAIHKYA